MGNQNEKQTQVSGRDAKQQRPGEQFIPEQDSFSLPNSFRLTAPMMPPPGVPNSLMREMIDDPGPDTETGRFFGSNGFRTLSPNRRNRSMSAGAYSFGTGPLAEGHELSHIVRREAVPAGVSLSVPANIIQRDPPGDTDQSNTGSEIDDDARDEARDEARSDPKEAEKAQITQAATADGADDVRQTFGTDKKSRWRISINRFSSFKLTPRVLESMSKYYKAYCVIHGIDTTNDVDDDKILGALQEAQSALPPQSSDIAQNDPTNEPPVRTDSPDLLGDGDAPDGAAHAGQDEQPAYARGLINPSAGTSRRWSTSEALRNTGASALNIGRASVLRHHYNSLGNNRVSPKYDPKNWKLSDTKWTTQASPWLGTLMGAWNGVSGAANMISHGDDLIKRIRNHKAGQSGWDAFQSGADTVSAAASSMGGFWSGVQNAFGGIGKSVETQASLLNGGAFGNAVKAVPWLGMISGAGTFLSGGSQFVRGANSWRQMNNNIDELGNVVAQNDPENKNRNKLLQIFNQGKSISQLNTWGGLMKTISGAATAVGSGLTLGGMAPAGMAVSAVGGGLNAIKTVFERVWKHNLRSKVVAEDYHINWSAEKDAVRDMIKLYNENLGMRNKYVREIILRAHGSTETTRTGAFKELKLKRARFLINIANRGGDYSVVAGKVIESLGVKRKGPGGTFADAAANILAEKLG